MKKHVLVSAALAVVMMANVLFTIDAQAVSRTETVEVTGVSRTLEGAIDGQVLGARRGEVISSGVSSSVITNKDANSVISDVNKVAAIINEYLKLQSGSANEVKATDISVINAFELKPDNGIAVSKEEPLYVSFGVPSVTANTSAWVLHYGSNGWEVVPTAVVDGKVVGMFTSLSPVSIVVDKSSLNGSVLGAARKKSPRTGDNFWLLIIAGAGIVAGTAVLLQKKYLHD